MRLLFVYALFCLLAFISAQFISSMPKHNGTVLGRGSESVSRPKRQFGFRRRWGRRRFYGGGGYGYGYGYGRRYGYGGFRRPFGRGFGRWRG